jgi:predicted nuclease of restriction endonuclease-like (RecB) superfamily
LVHLYWQVGSRIHKDVLAQRRAEYGRQIVAALGRDLEAEFGSGFGEKTCIVWSNLPKRFPMRKLSPHCGNNWVGLIFGCCYPSNDATKRAFYAEMCRVESWSTRMLQQKIDGMLYERTALSKKPARLIQQELAALRTKDQLTPDLVFKDPYVLDFLGLRDTYSEKDLEAALLREIERFLLELGAGFAFLERQKRIVVDGEDFYLDLLFYHRRLRRLVLVELKLGAFQAADFGQMRLYLRWLDRYERQPEEESPIGLVLCAGKSDERIELLELEQTGIRVAQYLTELPPKKVLQQRLHAAIAEAKIRLEQLEERQRK